MSLWEHSPPHEEEWTRHQEKYCEATANGADGVVAHNPWFRNAFRNMVFERPPRLRHFGTGPISYWRSHPSSRGGECAHNEQFADSFPFAALLVESYEHYFNSETLCSPTASPVRTQVCLHPLPFVTVCVAGAN